MSEMWNLVDKLGQEYASGSERTSISQDHRGRSDAILSRIETSMKQIVQAIAKDESPCLRFHNRSSWENVCYTVRGGIHMVDRPQITTVRFDATTSVTRFSIMVKILAIIHRLVQTGTTSTKRDIYYQDCELYGSQAVVDKVVDDLSCMIGYPRWDLNVVATSKGCVAGDFTYVEEDGRFVDCSETSNGVLIPSNIRGLANLRTHAKAVLVIEKDATFQKLLDDGITKSLHPVILITGKGFPDVNTRLLLRRLWDEFHLPTFALVDADPHGVEIIATYKFGSKSLSFEAHDLVVPSVYWLGILPSDIKRFCIPQASLIPMSGSDTDKSLSLIERPGISSNPAWTSELQEMLKMGVKAEIQTLTSLSDGFLSEVYLPNKIRYGGWI